MRIQQELSHTFFFLNRHPMIGKGIPQPLQLVRVQYFAYLNDKPFPGGIENPLTSWQSNNPTSRENYSFLIIVKPHSQRNNMDGVSWGTVQCVSSYSQFLSVRVIFYFFPFNTILIMYYLLQRVCLTVVYAVR